MFVLTLPIIFEYTSLLSPVALLVIFITMLGIFYISAPFPDMDAVTESHEHLSASSDSDEADAFQQKMPFLYKAWYGFIPLWQVFWPYFILVNIILYASDRAVRETVLSVPTWDNILLICIVTGLWWCIGVWRMSAHCHLRLYSALARVMTLALFSDFILRIFIRIKYPRIFFDCEGMLFDYSSCF